MKKETKKNTKKRLYNRKDPVDYRIKDLSQLIKASGKTLYRIQKETGLPSGFLHHLKSKKSHRENPSFSTMTRLMKALGLKHWDELIEPIPSKKK